jgi:hypothetical protein
MCCARGAVTFSRVPLLTITLKCSRLALNFQGWFHESYFNLHER